MVGGFRKKTIKVNEEAHGDELPAKNNEVLGHLGLGVEDREVLDVEIGQTINVLRGDVHDVVEGVVLRIVPGREGKAALTGSARSVLGLKKFVGHDSEPDSGDVVVFENIDGVLHVVRSDVEKSVGDYLKIPRKE